MHHPCHLARALRSSSAPAAQQVRLGGGHARGLRAARMGPLWSHPVLHASLEKLASGAPSRTRLCALPAHAAVVADRATSLIDADGAKHGHETPPARRPRVGRLACSREFLLRLKQPSRPDPPLAGPNLIVRRGRSVSGAHQARARQCGASGAAVLRAAPRQGRDPHLAFGALCARSTHSCAAGG